LHESGNYGMTTAQVDNDMGWCWFGLAESTKPILLQDALIPVGLACNLHCQIFSDDLLKEYGRLMPDIFRSYCTESVFSFLNAAIKKKWIISSKVRVHHAFNVPDGQPDNGDGIDGHSSGFKAPPGTWDDVWPPHTMNEIIMMEKGTKSGFGYEELRQIKNHDKACFDENGYCKNDLLKEFIKMNLYRQPQDFKYENIDRTIIKC